MYRQITFLAAILVHATIMGAAAPSAREILDQVRLQNRTSSSTCRATRSGATVIHFRITQTGPVIRYTSQSSGGRAITVGRRWRPARPRLLNSTKKSPLRASTKGSGDCITYGDLAPSSLLAECASDRRRHAPHSQLLEAAPHRSGEDANIDRSPLVDKESGALMRMEGYDPKSQLVKRFEVVSAQKIEGRWFLKQMRIEEMEPGRNKVRSRSYLEIKK